MLSWLKQDWEKENCEAIVGLTQVYSQYDNKIYIISNVVFKCI